MKELEFELIIKLNYMFSFLTELNYMLMSWIHYFLKKKNNNTRGCILIISYLINFLLVYIVNSYY